MSDQDPFKLPNPEQYAREVLERSKKALGDAVEVVAGNRDADPLKVFPAPGEVRNEDEGLQLSDEQAAKLRAAAAELGFERQTDLPLSEAGLQGAHVIIEGGQPHKIVAEAKMVVEDAAANPKTIIFSASPYRRISSDAEKISARNQFGGQEPETEYDTSRMVAEGLAGFVAHKEELVLPIGYDINNEFGVTQEATGQFVEIGRVGDTPVVLMRIDRESYTDEEGKAKYRKQPGFAEVMAVVAEISSVLGDDQAPVAFVTSGTYEPSRSVGAARSAIRTERVVGVATYGTARLAEVNSTDVPEPRRLEQLPGELHKMANEVAQLETVLSPQA